MYKPFYTCAVLTCMTHLPRSTDIWSPATSCVDTRARDICRICPSWQKNAYWRRRIRNRIVVAYATPPLSKLSPSSHPIPVVRLQSCAITAGEVMRRVPNTIPNNCFFFISVNSVNKYFTLISLGKSLKCIIFLLRVRKFSISPGIFAGFMLSIASFHQR